ARQREGASRDARLARQRASACQRYAPACLGVPAGDDRPVARCPDPTRDAVAMALMSQAAYARHRGISRVAVHLRTATKGGPIPIHGPRKLIDPAEADALWDATKSRAGWSAKLGATEGLRGEPVGVVSGTNLAAARAAALVVDVQTKRLVLEQRRGALIS